MGGYDEPNTLSFILQKGKASLEINPQCGGALRSWSYDQKDIFCSCPDMTLNAQTGTSIGAYPLVPYVNAMTQGKFSFGEYDYQLAPNKKGLPYPIDGNGWENVWNVAHKTDSHAILSFDFKPVSSDGTDSHWPFSYRAVISYTLFEKALEVELVLENRDNQSQPVGLGFRPFFKITPADRLSFSSQDVWAIKEGGLPGEKRISEGEWSFSEGAPFYERSLDHVFTKFGGEVLLKCGGGPNIKLTADSIFSFLCVSSPKESGFIALAPVTMMTDGFNHPEIEDRGVNILKAGQRVGGKMRFTLTDN